VRDLRDAARIVVIIAPDRERPRDRRTARRLLAVAERRDIPDALREAVERTVQATVDTRVRAQDAVDDLGGTVDELVKNAEKGLRTGRRSVRAAVGERLPATQDEMKVIRAELRKISKRLDSIEARLPGPPEPRARSKPRAKPRAKSPARNASPKKPQSK